MPTPCLLSSPLAPKTFHTSRSAPFKKQSLKTRIQISRTLQKSNVKKDRQRLGSRDLQTGSRKENPSSWLLTCRQPNEKIFPRINTLFLQKQTLSLKKLVFRSNPRLKRKMALQQLKRRFWIKAEATRRNKVPKPKAHKPTKRCSL